MVEFNGGVCLEQRNVDGKVLDFCNTTETDVAKKKGISWESIH